VVEVRVFLALMSRATTAACTTPTLSYIAEQSCILSFPLHPILLACSSVSGACHLHLQFAKKKKKKFFHLFEGFFISSSTYHHHQTNPSLCDFSFFLLSKKKRFFPLFKKKTHKLDVDDDDVDGLGSISLRLERTERTGTQISTYSIFALISFLFRQETSGHRSPPYPYPNPHPSIRHPPSSQILPSFNLPTYLEPPTSLQKAVIRIFSSLPECA